MRVSTSQRGVSEILGAIMIFALVFSVLVIIQVFAVPAANAQAEFQHSTAVEAEMGELGESFERLAASGSSESTSIRAGLRYPSRMFLINPPPASYTFSSSEVFADGVEIRNIGTATIDPEADEYITDVKGGVLSYDTQSYSLITDYAHYQNAPAYRIEGGLLYKQFDNDAVSFIDEGAVVNGRTINLAVFEGNIAEGGSGSFALQASAVSTTSQAITVTDDGSAIRVVLATSLSQDDWDDLLGDEDAVTNINVDEGAGTVTITLADDRTYDLRITKIRVGPDDVSPTATYLTAPLGTDVSMSGDATGLTVQVRDEFNNPLSGAEVTFDADGDGTFTASGSDTITVESDERGLATVQFEPDGDSTVEASIGSGAEKRVDFSVDVLSSGGSGNADTTDFINPHTTVILGDTTVLADANGLREVEMTFESPSGERTVKEARINFVMGVKPGGDGSPATGRLSKDQTYTQQTEMEAGGPLVEPSVASATGRDIVIGTTDTPVYLKLTGDVKKNTDVLVVISFVYDDDSSGTYFVGAQGD